jgi:hypothetical protein
MRVLIFLQKVIEGWTQTTIKSRTLVASSGVVPELRWSRAEKKSKGVGERCIPDMYGYFSESDHSLYMMHTGVLTDRKATERYI